MQDIRNFRDANGAAVQPYFAAYMIECGFRTVDEALSSAAPSERTVAALSYILWNERKWSEFEREIGATRPRSCYAAEFTDWLANPEQEPAR